MQKIFITGGAGFIGSHLFDILLKQGHLVICFDNFDPFYDRSIKESNLLACSGHKNFEFIEGEIRDIKLLAEVFSKNDFNLIVHLAAKAGVRPSVENPQLKSNTRAGRDKMLKEKINVTAFLVWFIENYPESAKIMKENPKYQYRFK